MIENVFAANYIPSNATPSTNPFIESDLATDTSPNSPHELIYTSTLKKLHRSDAKDFSMSGKLREQIEAEYHVKLGRYVRHIDGKVYLFFPNKTGLTGNGWAKREWESTVWDHSNNSYSMSIKCGTDCELAPIAYRYRYKSLGLREVTEELFESQPSNCLFAWYKNRLYRVGVANIDGTMCMEKVCKPQAHTC